VGDLLGKGRRIRAGRTLPEVLNEIRLVDHHAHGILRGHPRTIDEFRGLFSESGDPRQWPHVATGLSYRRGIAELAAELGCEATEEGVFGRRVQTDPDEYAAALLRATGTEWLLVDDGYPPADVSHGWEQLGELAGSNSRPVLRIEHVGEEALGAARDLDEVRRHVLEEVRTARARGFAGLKTIAAYRTGLDVGDADAEKASAALGDAGRRLAAKPLLDLLLRDALAANAADPLPVQVHTGFGDGDLALERANPTLLKPLVESHPETPFVLLHCYPYVREAGWMAHVYPNVFFDLSLTIPHVARPVEALHEALELAPVSKLLYASDAARAPELYFLAAKRWRESLAEVVSEDDARAILRENALSLYRL
jgi:predicted TIM-barrel fold metal-dependent hydrolase